MIKCQLQVPFVVLKNIVHKPGHSQIHHSILREIIFFHGAEKGFTSILCILHLFKYVVILYLTVLTV